MGRSPRASAFAAALVLVALVGPTAAISSVFTGSGKTFVVSTTEWTLISPFSDAGGGTGVFYNVSSIFTFTAPKNKGPRSKDGTTVKRATTMKFNKITLTPVTVTATGLQPISGAPAPILRLRVKLPKGSLVPQTSSVSFPLQGTAFPYAMIYGGPSQVNPTLLTPNTGAKVLGKPTLQYGKVKVKLSTGARVEDQGGVTFQLATAGVVSTTCAGGYGGALTTTTSGCAQCPAGSFGSNLDQSQACKSCSTVSPPAIAATPGASACTPCPSGQSANAAGTACVSGPNVTCAANQYIKPGASTCSPCGNGATAAAGQATTCTCKTTAVYNTTTDTCVCSSGSYDPTTGCSSSICATGQYFDTASKLCQKCPSGCSACSDAYTCTACSAGDDSSLVKTAQGYNPLYSTSPSLSNGNWLSSASAAKCQSCIPNCKECSSGTGCTTCNYGYYSNQGVWCTLCPSNCATCTSNGVCTACKPGYFLGSGAVCTPCADSIGGILGCATCTNNGTTCTSCKPGYGFNSTSGACFACSGCAQGACAGSATLCTACTPVNNAAATNGFYYAPSPQTCEACTNLGNLNTPGATGFCAKCSANKNLCETCADGSYITSDLRCQGCIANCNKCSGPNTCDECAKGYYRDPTLGTCVPCSPGLNCDSCSEAGKCTSCLSVTSGSPPVASVVRFLDPTTKGCSVCTVPNAFSCSSAGVATRCNPGFFVNNGLCVPCGTNCAVCANSGGTAGNCALCSSGSVVAASPANCA